jgi:pimeloyl-ACP methyl ester carboxylesterase
MSASKHEKDNEFSRRTFEIAGTVIQVAERGSGDGVVWLRHREADASFPPLADELADDCRMIVIHQSRPNGEALNAALARLDVGRFVLIGQSSGAGYALEIATANGAACEALILLAPALDALPTGGMSPDMPILLLLGTDDRDVPPNVAATICARLPRAHPILVYGAGPSLDRDRVEAVAAVTRDFLARRDKFIVRDASDRLYP